jgi:hypothetical protein
MTIGGPFLVLDGQNMIALKVYENGILLPSRTWYEFLTKKESFVPFKEIQKMIWVKTDNVNFVEILHSNVTGFQFFNKYYISNIDKFVEACKNHLEIIPEKIPRYNRSKYISKTQSKGN